MPVRDRISSWLCLGCAALWWAHAETLPIRSYTVAEGLAHDHVSSIVRDSHDFLWICTDEGLSRFDGRQFVNYTVADGLPHIHVNDIIETRSGSYWVATDGGVALFRPDHPEKRFTTFRPDGPPQALFVNVLREEPDGAVLAGTAAGLYRLRLNNGGARFEQIAFGAPAGEREASSVNSLYREPDGTLWVGTVSGLYRRDLKGAWARFMSPDGLPHDFVDTITADPQGRIWICTRHGIARLSPKPQPGSRVVDLTVTTENGLPHRDTRDILFLPDGRRWISTLGGLVEWAGGAPLPANFRVYSAEDGLTDQEVYDLTIGPDGNLWIGSRRGGVMCLDRTGFVNFGKADGLSLTGSDQIVETPAGGICIDAISESRRPIRCLDGRRFRAVEPRLPRAVTESTPTSNQSVLVDHLGAWWIATPRGVVRFGSARSGPGIPKGEPNLRLIQDREARHLWEDSRHDIWITTFRGWKFGLMRWNRAQSRLEDLALPDVARERSITAFAEGPGGQIWIGLGRPGGLYRLRNGRFEQVSGAPAGNIQNLYCDRSKRLWIASADAGLGRIDHPEADRVSVHLYDRLRGLSSNEIWCVTEDRYGRIYAGTARGVDQIDPVTERITHYSNSDGLVKGDIRAALADHKGRLWFLSNRGLSRLDPVQKGRQPAIEARITGVHVAGAPQPISDLGELQVPASTFSWKNNSVRIDFSSIDFRAPDQVRYQFLLKGAAGGWSEPSTTSTVYFSNLAPGRYQFLVRAINSDGASSRTPASFAFTISPAPWRQWWFQAGIAGILLGLGFLGHRVRLEARVALERVRSRIATDLHDDIGASLARIAVMSEVVKDRVQASDRDSHHMLGDIAETSRGLVDEMGDIVWSIDPRRDNLADVIARLRAFGSDVLEARGIHWTCDGPSDALGQKLSPDQRRQFYLIFKEAIHNIAQHSEASNVALRIGVEDSRIWAGIEDDGRGFSPDAGQGMGLASMQRRAERLGGDFWIGTRPEGGTKATLEFSLRLRKA